MRNFYVLLLSFLLLLCLVGNTANAQQPLNDLARKSALQSRANRTVAESIATANHIPFQVSFPGGRYAEIQRFEDGIPIINTTCNINAAHTIGTNKVWPGSGFGFSLSGVTDTLGEWDGGAPLATHQEFGGRVLSTEGALIAHSTHVAGTMIAAGLDANAHGMSYQACLRAHDWVNDAGEMAGAAAGGLHISNHSYGTVSGWDYDYFGDGKWVWFGDTTISGSQDYRFGFYDNTAQSWDDVAYNAPDYLIVKAAGNDRGEGPFGTVLHWVFNRSGQRVSSSTSRPVDGGATGYRTITDAATAKNVLVVGAVQAIPGGYTGPGDVVMSSFSGWGPTNDGRIKPDVVSDGISLYSTLQTSNTAYGTMSGTSMATPTVSGSTGLLLHYQRQLHGNTPLRAATLRALIDHTADDAGAPGPDYQFGWGLMNTYNAIQLMRADSADGDQAHIRELQLIQGNTYSDTLYCDGYHQLKVTICWTDSAGVPAAKSLNPTKQMLINDLDLRLIRLSDHAVFTPWILDPNNPSNPATTGDNTRDNIEQVLVPTPTTDPFLVVVTHKKTTLSDGLQNFSMVISGNVLYDKPIVVVTYPDSSYPLRPGETAPESLRIVNAGNRPVHYTLSGNGTWLIPESGTLAMPGADSGFIHFTVDASLFSQWSQYTDTITVTSDDPDHPSVHIPITIATTGPKIQGTSSIVVEIDSSQTRLDTIWLHNTGTLPLTFTVSDIDIPPVSWISFNSGEAGTIGPGDSSRMIFNLDAALLEAHTHIAQLKIASNDSSTGDMILSITLHVYARLMVHPVAKTRWNLLSLPVTVPDNRRVTLFPTAEEGGFFFDGSYHLTFRLSTGLGYWLKFPTPQTLSLYGGIIEDDTVTVIKGWNLIGSISVPLPAASLSSDPPGMIVSPFFEYEGGYAQSDTIKPGKGYWVKVETAGSIFLHRHPVGISSAHLRIVPVQEHPPAPPGGEKPAASLPAHFALENAYPNPFNPGTRIDYALPVDADVSLKIYNVLGEEIAVLVNERQIAGYHSAQLTMGNVPSGVYLCRLNAGAFTQTTKVMLMK